MNPSFWAGKNVFITGHTGFKGSWLCLYLHRLGAYVTGYSLEPPTSPSLFDVAHIGEHLHSLHGDIRDREKLDAAMKASHPDIVIHLAAQSLVRLSYADPLATYATNVMGSVHVFEAVRNSPGVRAAINVTSDKCYKNRESAQGYREDDALGGHDPYSNSKACAELVTSAYRDSFFNSTSSPLLASVRAGNVIGGGDWAKDRLIPDIMRALGAGETAIIRNPASIRPWQHVLEPLSGYLLLAEKLYGGNRHCASGWNFGPDDNDTQAVNWIADRVVQHWGDLARWKTDSHLQQPHETSCLKLDSTKARTQLSWSPRWNLDTALHKTVSWYQAMLNGQDMFAYSLQQIDDYLQPQNTISQ